MLPRLETDPDEEFTGAEIRTLTARVAASHRTARRGELLSDALSVVTATAITAGLVVGTSGVVRDLLLVPPADPVTPGLDLSTVRMLLLLAGFALATTVAARLGPLALSGAGLRWWLPMPVDRRGLLSARMAYGLLLWSVSGAAFVTLVTASTGVPVTAWSLTTSTVTGAVSGSLVVTVVGLLQRRRQVLAGIVAVGDLILALTPVLGVAAVATGLARDTGAGASTWWTGGPLVAAALAALACGLVAGAWQWRRGLEALGAGTLAPATSVTEQAGTAVVSLDLRELARALDRPGARRPPRRSHDPRWVRGPVTALLAAEAVAVLRNPIVLAQALGLGALVVLAREIPALAGGLGQALVLVVVGIRSAQVGAQGARSAEVSPVLDSLLPLSARVTRLIRAVVPTAVACVSLVIGCAPQIADDPRWLLVLVAAAGCFGAAAVRGAYRKPPDWSTPLLATPAGAVHTGALSAIMRGPDLAAVGVIPLLVAVATGAPGWAIVGLQVLFSVAALGLSSSVRRRDA